MKQKLLLIFAVLAMAINASAYDFEVDGFYYNVVSPEELTCEVTYKVYERPTYSGDIVIPSSFTYNGITFSVTSIGDAAFCGCSSLTSVNIPGFVASIGKAAFGFCSSLTSFTGKFATEDHRGLIVDGVLISVAPVNLTSYKIPNSVTAIGDMAFSDSPVLRSVEIPNSVTEIGRCVFYS